MANLRVFVSSTCVDLGIHREQLRGFLQRMGYEPIMSDFSDVLYDPSAHTHTSCVLEVANSDIVIILIGSRFGGEAVPEAIGEIDVPTINSYIASSFSGENDRRFSITQLEAFKAISLGIPLVTFVDSGVRADHHLYTKNKNREFIDQIEFPSISKKAPRNTSLTLFLLYRICHQITRYSLTIALVILNHL